MTTEPVVPIIEFLRHPTFHVAPAAHLMLWRWVGWLCFQFVVAIIVGGTVGIVLVDAFGWHVPSDAFLSYLTTHPSVAAASGLLFAPIFEELGFRAFLSTNAKAVFIGLTFFLAYLVALVRVYFMHVTGAYVVAHQYEALWLLVPAGIVSLSLYHYVRAPILKFFQQHGAWVFWISCTIFGAGHAADFTNGRLVWWGFVLALPQFFGGLGLAYLRVTYGLRWSMLAHWVFDWFLMSMAWARLVLTGDQVAKATIAIAEFVVVVFLVVYGLVVLVRVARRRW